MSRLLHHYSWIDLHRLPALLMIFFLASSTVLYSRTTVYVNPSRGSDAHAGTLGSPFRTISHGLSAIGSGGIVYLRGGTYTFANGGCLDLKTAATSANPIRIWAYGNERAVLDFAGDTVGQGILLRATTRYYHLRGIDERNCVSLGIDMYGSHNTIENCSFSYNGQNDMGWPPGGILMHCDSSLILNCDAYHNWDMPVGENANGFVVSGKGNVLRGCRAWENADDGFDLWYSVDRIVLDGCYSFRNGVGTNGNGMGFKLGGSLANQSDTSRAWHLLRNCVAFDNRGMNYDRNLNPRGQTFYNCTGSRSQTGVSYNLGSNAQPDTIYNCLDYLARDVSPRAFGDGSILITNSWQIKTVTREDFASVDTSGISAWTRNTDGSLPTLTFLRLASTSTLIDAGTNVGLPFVGSAPDVGAFEYMVY
jgi:hypothetical protein